MHDLLHSWALRGGLRGIPCHLIDPVAFLRDSFQRSNCLDHPCQLIAQFSPKPPHTASVVLLEGPPFLSNTTGILGGTEP